MSGQQNHKGGIGSSLKSKFKEGDLVSWKKLGTAEKTYAFVVRIVYRAFYNNRSFYTAEVITSSGETKEINLALLKLESKADLEE